MQLPSLPIKEGALFVDNTFLELITECNAKVLWNKLYSKVRSGGNAALDFGSCIHLVLEHRYKTSKDKPVSDEVFNEQCDLIHKWFDLHPVDEFERRSEQHAIEVIKRYNMKYQAEPFNVLKDTTTDQILIEKAFALPLYSAKMSDTAYPANLPIVFSGKIDLPTSLDSKIVIWDHKTDSMFFGPIRAIEEQMCSNQPLGYAYAFEKTTGCKVDGLGINMIPTKDPPAKPKDGIDNWWNTQFIRDVKWLATQPNWRQEWFESACTQVDHFLWLYQRGTFPMTGKFQRMCNKYGGCPYLDICTKPTLEERLSLLDSGVYTENTWSPLKH